MLISGAIKHGGNVCKVKFGLEDHGDEYVFNIWDRVPGVPAEKRVKVFEKIESTGRTGLGLPLIRDLIEKQDGRLWYEHIICSPAMIFPALFLHMPSFPAICRLVRPSISYRCRTWLFTVPSISMLLIHVFVTRLIIKSPNR